MKSVISFLGTLWQLNQERTNYTKKMEHLHSYVE